MFTCTDIARRSLQFCSVVVGNLSASEERVSVGIEELHDLKGVWAELSKIWQQIDDMKEKPWLSVQPRKVSSLLFCFSADK